MLGVGSSVGGGRKSSTFTVNEHNFYNLATNYNIKKP